MSFTCKKSKTPHLQNINLCPALKASCVFESSHNLLEGCTKHRNHWVIPSYYVVDGKIEVPVRLVYLINNEILKLFWLWEYLMNVIPETYLQALNWDDNIEYFPIILPTWTTDLQTTMKIISVISVSICQL